MTDVAVIGAGPFGLAVAGAMRDAGASTHVFGRRMSYWREHMPAGMLLRSGWIGCSIGDVKEGLTVARYEKETGNEMARPVPLDEFVAYGDWYGEQVAPDLDQRRVVSVRRSDGGFEVIPEEGAPVRASRVVMATGLDGFAWRPPEFSALDEGRVVHTADVSDPSRFDGRSVLVVGGGQSAVETAALLHEAGAQVELVLRRPGVHWLTRAAWLRSHSGPFRQLLYPPTDVGPPGYSAVVARPNLWRRLPRRTREHIAARSIRPAAAAWLVDRTADMKMTPDRHVVEARPEGDGVEVTLDDGSRRRVDNIVLGTGFRIDVTRHPLLDESLKEPLEVREGYPVLRRGYVSSVPGLYFVGASAARSFGAIMRFVAGTWFVTPAIRRHVERSS